MNRPTQSLPSRSLGKGRRLSCRPPAVRCERGPACLCSGCACVACQWHACRFEKEKSLLKPCVCGLACRLQIHAAPRSTTRSPRGAQLEACRDRQAYPWGAPVSGIEPRRGCSDNAPGGRLGDASDAALLIRDHDGKGSCVAALRVHVRIPGTPKRACSPRIHRAAS